ncbi:MAG TPA: cytochrome c oxidase assembly protein [Thermomicrobiales bacterium]|nr:cytochrome c oxidase assembly protein [Thermomicrobiales bacterium]
MTLSDMHLPFFHVSAEPPSGFLSSHWRLEPSLAITVVALVAGYLLWIGPIQTRARGSGEERSVRPGQVAAFLAGCAGLLVALGPPIDDWSQYFLLSAHMVQHLLLTLFVPPMLLLGIPEWMWERTMRAGWVRRAGYVLTRPAVGFLLAALAIVVWHLPPFYVAALRSEPVHILEHQAFLLTGLLAWWPLAGSFAAWPRLSPPLQCLYLFLSTIPAGVVGAVITLADPGLYPPYGDAPRRLWGLNVATDQEIAGLLMWVGGNTIYLLLITVIFLRWAAREEARDRQPTPMTRGSAGSRP